MSLFFSEINTHSLTAMLFQRGTHSKTDCYPKNACCNSKTSLMDREQLVTGNWVLAAIELLFLLPYGNLNVVI
jgi:hypothetical protein